MIGQTEKSYCSSANSRVIVVSKICWPSLYVNMINHKTNVKYRGVA